ncbi:MAG: sulfatase [Bacteroidales bacterium]|nr:sulfatase [Bacteroidales bacterium]
MKRFSFIASVLIITSLLSCRKASHELPNIVLIVADDLGWKDLGFMGSEYYETPHLDQLARAGMVFNQAYAAAANCAPSRACLMTGMYTTAHGIYTVGSPERGDARTRKLIPADNRDSLSRSFFTLAEELQDAGYITCSIGKWHLGDDPRTQGFDFNVGGGIWGHPGSYFAPYLRPDLYAPDGEYLTDRLTGEAQHFIRENKDNSFFLYLPYYAVHTPIQPKKTFEQKYLEKGSRGCQTNAAYAGMVDNMDRCIGLVLDEIRAQGVESNTLVIFTSDNGGIRRISCQDPLRAGKGSYYEGGIRVPLVMKWPGEIEAGSDTDVPVINIDFYPTLLEIIGKEPSNSDLDGESLWPLVKGITAAIERPLYFHFPIYLQAYHAGYDDGRDPLFRTRPGSVIRDGDWKLHCYYEDGGLELYNLETDPGERNNLAGINASKADELLGKLKAWLEEEDAPVAFQQNPQYDSVYEQQEIQESSL